MQYKTNYQKVSKWKLIAMLHIIVFHLLKQQKSRYENNIKMKIQQLLGL